MTAKSESNPENRMEKLLTEAARIETKLQGAKESSNSAFESIDAQLQQLNELLLNADSLSDDVKSNMSPTISNLKSKLTELRDVHRDVHPLLSKYGKFIEKNLTEDISSLHSYFINHMPLRDTQKTVHSPFVKPGGPIQTADELLNVVIVEHFLRQGLDTLTKELMNAFGMGETDVCTDKFSELGCLVTSIYSGDLEPARNWLSEHKETLGNRAFLLEYTLVKLQFLSALRNQSHDPAAIIHHARLLVEFAQAFPSDFEHLMGSLLFMGRDLCDTPYADLALDPFVQHTDKESADNDGITESSSQPSLGRADSALTQAVNLFRSCYLHHISLSDVDPLCTVFNSGCRLLLRHQTIQRAISCLSKYSAVDGETLPVAVELDPTAHCHNIFHCPVIKEVTSSINRPVRLSCGHAISRDAFESLPSVDRNKVKCPYCPMETYKNQALDLIF